MYTTAHSRDVGMSFISGFALWLTEMLLLFFIILCNVLNTEVSETNRKTVELWVYISNIPLYSHSAHAD